MGEIQYIKEIIYFIFFAISNIAFVWLVQDFLLFGWVFFFWLWLQLFTEGGDSVEPCTAALRFSDQSVALCGERRKCSRCVLNLVTSSNFDNY